MVSAVVKALLKSPARHHGSVRNGIQPGWYIASAAISAAPASKTQID